MRFSIIVPIYNVEKYLEKCIESILNQTNQNFELLLINDGTKDNSQKIIDKYVTNYPDKIYGFIKKNGGLSDARNYGVERAKGEYILFIDSDDYIDKRLLEKINLTIENDNMPDVIGFSLKKVDLNNNVLGNIMKPEFHSLSGKEAISKLVESKEMFEPACGFAYNRKYWFDNGYKYEKNLYHEDFALTPIVVLKANNVSSTNFLGYFYVQTENSIMRNDSVEKELKKNSDLLKAFDILKMQIDKYDEDKNIKLLKSYIANALLYRYFTMNKKMAKDYKKELIKRNVVEWIIDDSIKRKIRKLIIKIKFYII